MATVFNVYEIRSSDSLWSASGVTVSKAEGSQYLLATTQMHFNLEDRDFGKAVGVGDRDILAHTDARRLPAKQKEPNEEEERQRATRSIPLTTTKTRARTRRTTPGVWLSI